MSFEYYSKWWAATREKLEELAAKDEYVVKTTKPIKDRNLASQLVGGLYAKYSMIVQEIGTLLDQMCQPQKRLTVRKLMDAATIRLHELNEELRKIDISEYHYIDGVLVELKLIPHDVEILDPIFYYLRHYTIEDLWKKIKNGERIYTPPPEPEISPKASQNSEVKIEGDEQIPSQNVEEQPKEKAVKKKPQKFVPEVKVLTLEEQEELRQKERITTLLTLIQTHERARQARLYFSEKFAVHQFRKEVQAGKKAPPPNLELQEPSSLTIQRLWRGHCARQYIKRKEKERRLLIGMTEPSWKSKKEFEILEGNLQKRRDLRDLRIREYIEANLAERERVFTVIGPRLMEDIGDEIREWFFQWYKRARNFDKYPPEEKGGTILVVRGETMTPEEWIEEVERKRREKVKNKGKDKEKAKKEKEKQKKLAAEKKKKEKEKKKKELAAKKKKKMKGEYELEFDPTATKGIYDEAFCEHREIWDERKDAENPLEKHYMDMITEEKCWEMQLELRRNVDELMRIELEMLEDALERDKLKMKGKKGKGKKKKKKKNKKKRKKKQKKDPTSHRSLEDLFQELVDNGIIHLYENAKLKDYKGDFSYSNWEKRNLDFDPPSTLGDVRQAVKINCVIPLSTSQMKKPKSVLLAGPRQSGKHLLANAVFTESQSVLFDLSPEILAGKYPGKKGMKMLLHLINKMTRILQPSIIYFEGAERVFYKKVPKPERHLEPKRMSKKLFKGIVKTILPQDRVLVFGITGRPWLAKQNQFKKAFERIILIPRPDYGSIYLYWRELLMPFHGVDRNFDVSCLAKLTTYFPLSRIREAVETVFTPRRIIQLCHRPLQQAELFEVLISEEPITDKEYSKFIKWYNKTPLGKDRVIFNKFAEIKREAEAKALEKQKQKK